jgi:hypothetical protein
MRPCLRGGGNRRHAKVARLSVGSDALVPSCLRADDIKARERTVGHQDLIGLRRFADSSGDVDVNAEVVTAESPRSSPMDAGAHARPVPVELDMLQRGLGFEPSVHRAARVRNVAIRPSPSRFTVRLRRRLFAPCGQQERLLSGSTCSLEDAP